MYNTGVEIPRVSFSALSYSGIPANSYFMGFDLDNSGKLSKLDNTGTITVIEGGGGSGGGISLTDLSVNAPLTYNNITGVFNIGQSSGSTSGFLSSIDWNKFNNKLGAVVTDVTHAQLVTLVNGDDLIPGTYYRITDYQTIYEQPDYTDLYKPVTTPIIKTGPTQPLMVLALTNNVLSEQAYQEEFPKDTIKYQLVYNTKKTNTPTKGRIYERVDENNNRTDFDHRNVLFKRYECIDYNLTEDLLLHYPFGKDNNVIELLAFGITPSRSNIYIEGNWNVLNSTESRYREFQDFDLPNIVLGDQPYRYVYNTRIGPCSNLTIKEIFDSEIKFASNSYISSFYLSEISYIDLGIIKSSIQNSKIGSITNSFILGYGESRIRECNIESISIGSFAICYDGYTPSNSNPYSLANIPLPQKYTPRALYLSDYFSTNIGYLGATYEPIAIIELINNRDGSKLHSGSSVFTPSATYQNVIIKNYAGNIISHTAKVITDSQGRLNFIQLEDGYNTPGFLENKGLLRPDAEYTYFYFETTTTNEVGKVPSNMMEQVRFIPSINNYGDLAGRIGTSIGHSDIREMNENSFSIISRSEIKEISNSSFSLIYSSYINYMWNVKTTSSSSIIVNTTIQANFTNVTYHEIHSCYFKNNVNNVNFGRYLGGIFDENLSILDKNSSDEYLTPYTSFQTIPKTNTFRGNVFNGHIYDSTFGDFVYSNVFNCNIGQDIPDYFANNTVNILPAISISSNYLSNFTELKEKTIACQINPVFKTYSELSIPVTVGTVFDYSYNERQQYYKLYAKVFLVEANYIDTVPRIWFVIDNEKLGLFPNDNFDDQSLLGRAVEKESQYQDAGWQTSKFFFGASNNLIGNTNTVVGKSVENISKLRKNKSLYSNSGDSNRDIVKILDSISNNQGSSYPDGAFTYGNESPNLDHLSIPTKGDLELIYSLNLIQRNDIVWSSSEIDANNAWAFDFATGQSVSRPKNTLLPILPTIYSIGLNTMELQYKRNSGIVTKPFPVNV